jgi:ribonuclease D
VTEALSDPVDPPEPPDDVTPPPVLLLEPADGVPPVVVDEPGLTQLVARFAAGHGPVAIDAERASGYRYSARAYLVQLRRDGSGSGLIDPTGVPDLTGLSVALGGVEWVLHAANQDLACLAEVGMHPGTLFDTELASRLLGYPRVALGTMVEQLLGVRLEKGHSAADWSTRPLPESWLAYAALDVELLLPLRDLLEQQLAEAGKLDWAHQEFAAVLATAQLPPTPRAEPWRRLSGIHKLRSPRQLAAARALWEARDEQSRRRDVAPGRVLPDTAILAAILAAPRSRAELAALPVFSGPRQRRLAGTWYAALHSAAGLADGDLPRIAANGNGDGPPPPNRWAERDPAAAARLTRVRAALAALAEAHTLPVENLLEPALSRRLAWEPPPAGAVEAALVEGGARPWQVQLTAAPLAAALIEA